MRILNRIILMLFMLFCASGFAQKYEAENGQLVGVQVAKTLTGYSGTGYVTGFDNDGDKVIVKFTAELANKMELFIGYAATSGDKTNTVIVNGETQGNLLFSKTSKFKEISAGNIQVLKGENTVIIQKSWGWFDVDYIRIDVPAEATMWNIDKEPINKKASPEAVSLYKFLLSNFGKTTFSGQFQDAGKPFSSSSGEIEYIHNKTTKYTALYGNDLIDYSLSRIEFGANSKVTEDVVNWYTNKGGMVTLTWHWNAPTDLYNTEENKWWSGFYTRATSFDIDWVLKNPDSEKYELLLRDIDAIAVQLKKLQAQKIPVLWRPLHEAEGAWFWWGAKGPEACVQLWRLLYDRLNNFHGINNLIWVWTTTDSPKALQWYPGDEYVDVLGVDVYLADGDYSASATMFNNLRGLFKGKKMLTMSENGTIPDPEKMKALDAQWLYFCTWTGPFINGGKQNSSSHINSVFNHQNITTLDELDINWPKFVGLNAVELKKKSPIAYPNPVTDCLNIEIEEEELLLSIDILTVNGSILTTVFDKPNSGVLSLPFHKYIQGVYFVRLNFKNEQQIVKVIK
jgi:mannan endo-1,4-beta-mannosidase